LARGVGNRVSVCALYRQSSFSCKMDLQDLPCNMRYFFNACEMSSARQEKNRFGTFYLIKLLIKGMKIDKNELIE